MNVSTRVTPEVGDFYRHCDGEVYLILAIAASQIEGTTEPIVVVQDERGDTTAYSMPDFLAVLGKTGKGSTRYHRFEKVDLLDEVEAIGAV